MKAYRNQFFILMLLWLLAPASVLATTCDVDDDGDADRNDITLIVQSRGAPASGPNDPRDADGDGTITVLDARRCVLQCTLPRCAIIDPPVDVPTIDVSPGTLNFGDVFVGSSASLPLNVGNTGNATLSVSNIGDTGAPFSVFPPLTFDIAEGGPPRSVDIGFSPTEVGIFNGTVTINSNADNIDPVVVEVTGNGVEPTPDLAPDIDNNDRLVFGAIGEGAIVEQQLTIRNLGDAPLDVNSITSDSAAFQVAPVPGQNIPFVLDPGASQNVVVTFVPPVGSAGTIQDGLLTILSNDPDESPGEVSLLGDVLPSVEVPINNPILSASADDTVGPGNCVNVTGEVLFGVSPVIPPTSEPFFVILTDQGGDSASAGPFDSDPDGGPVSFSGIDACILDDGILELSVNLGALDPFIGNPTIKNTTAFPAPVLNPVAAASVQQIIRVCGTSRESTTVSIEGGANTVSTTLDNVTTAFCLDVPLRPNSENTLIATAVDNLAVPPPPRPRASASPIQVTHVDPSSVIIAEATSRPLTVEETQQLVDNGVIDLDDPTNFNVSMFTIVLTIGAFPVTVSQPVAVPSSPGISYGSSPGSGWGGGGGAPTGSPGSSSGGGCTSGCSNIVVITTPSGQVIPGVIIIDGRIKTLKEFFQVTIAIQNTSSIFTLSDMVANIALPSGLSPVKSGPGTDVSTINTGSALDTVDIGEINAGDTGTGQFIIRGDGIGTHNVDVDFNGFLTGGGLAQPEPVNGSASTSVQVFGPPTFDVTVRHPSRAGDNNDVLLNEIYDLIVEIENTSSRPALYTSLELFVGGQALLVDEFDNPLPNSNQIVSFGTIPAGRAVEAAFRVKSLVQGEIIACQAVAAENINLTVDTGPANTDCNIANTYPANFEPLPADQPPVVLAINPLNGQPDIPVTTSVFATLTPQSCNIVGDTFNNIVTALINPADPSEGIQVISADLDQAGTFYLEELDTLGNPVRHIPTDLTVENPPAGGTTIAVLRLGLASPLSQFFLSPNTTYRATLVGGPGGIASCASGAEMALGYSWIFSTEQACSGILDPVATLSTPPDGSIDRPLNQSITIDFTNRMDPGSFSFSQADPLSSSFAVFQGALEGGGDITGGAIVPGNAVFSNLFRTLTYTPIGNLPNDTSVHIRLTDGLRDICGNSLVTTQQLPDDVQLFDFTTIELDTMAPPVPVVNPVLTITNLPSVQVSGTAEASSTVTVTGGSAVVSTTTSSSDNFSVSVPLNLNSINDLEVQAEDASGNTSSPVVVLDNNGDPLTTVHDNILPAVQNVFPVDGATGVARDIVITADFDEDIDPATINDLNFTLDGSVIPGSLAPVGSSGFSFTPDNPLDFNSDYTIRIRANGMRDLAGNGLDSEFSAVFSTVTAPNSPAVADPGPDQTVLVNDTVTLDGSGSSDGDGDPLTFSWSLTSRPLGSSAALSDPTAVMPTFVADVAGTYVAELIVNDGTVDSAPDTVTVTTANSPPVADAGPGQAVLVGDTVALDGSGSGDVDGDPLTFSWSLTSRPVGSSAALSDPTAVMPTFVADVAGTYVAELIVNDGTVDSAADTVTVTMLNSAPVADAGPGQAVLVGDTVALDGSGSSDADGNPLTYAWSLTSVPAGSAAALSDPTAVQPTFVADRLGNYLARLIVNDGIVDSIADTVSIDATGCSINLGLVGTGLVGVGRLTDVAITLSEPAPAGGRSVTLQSDNTSILGVGAGGQVIIDEGETSGVIPVNGVAEGNATLTASAPGCEAQTLNVDVTLSVITTPVTLNVLFNQTSSFPVTIASPAPAGGQVVNLASSEPAVIDIDASVTIPEGAVSANATASGFGIGRATITASAAGFASDSTLAISSATIDIVESSASLTELISTDVTVQLLSSGTPVAAPPGGLVVDLTPANADCLAVPAQVTIPAGLVSKTVTLSYGGSTSTPCSTQLTADAADADADSITVTVNPPPGISLPFYPRNITAGATGGTGYYANLGDANHGGVNVTISSGDPTVALVAPNNTTTPGAASIDVFVPNGQTLAYYRLDALEGAAEGATATIGATAPGFAPSPLGTVTSVPLGFDIINLATTHTVFDVDDPFRVRLRSAPGGNPTGGEVTLRPGHPGLTFTIDNSNASVAQLVTTGTTAQQVTTQIQAYQSRSPNTVAAGGVAFDSLSAGSTDVSATSPDLAAGPAITVNISAPGMNLPFYPRNITAGATGGTGYYAQLLAPAPTDVTVTISSSDPTVALVAPNDTTMLGSASIDVTIPAGGTLAYYRLDAIEGATEGQTATISATAPAGYTPPSSGTVTSVPLGFDIINLATSKTSFDVDDPFRIRLRSAPGGNPTGGEVTLRPGHPGLTFTIDNSSASVAQLVTTASTGQQVTTQIQAYQSRSPNTVAAGGLAFDSLGAGSTDVSATSPGLAAGPAITVDISAPGMNLPFYPRNITAGATGGTGYYAQLLAPAPTDVTVTISSSDPSVALVAPNDTTTLGTASVDVTIPAGGTLAYYRLDAIEGATEGQTATISATAPLGYTPPSSGTVTSVPLGFDIINLATTHTVLDVDDLFRIRLRSAPGGNPTGGEVTLRPGHSGLTFTIDNSNAGVAQLVTTASTGQQVTTQIQAYQSRSPNTVAAGGVAFDSLGTGSTQVSATSPGLAAGPAISVTVDTPTITLNFLPVTVGGGLQINGYSISLGAPAPAGGIDVSLVVSNASIALIGPNGTTNAGSGNLVLSIPAGSSSATYSIQGVPGAGIGGDQTVTLTASAPGYVDEIGTITVRQPALDIISLNQTTTVGAADDPFRIRIGVANDTGTSIASEQVWRPDLGDLTVGVFASDDTVGHVVTSTDSGASVDVTISAGLARSPSSVAAGGVAFDPLAFGTTTLSGSIPGFLTTNPGGNRLVNVNP